MGALEIPSTSSFIRSFLVVVIPKLVVLILSALVAATLADMQTYASDATTSICRADGGGRLVEEEKNRDRAPRICFLGVAVSVISVFTALTLIQMDMIIFCAPGALKRLANAFGLLLDIMMTVFWLVTSALLANLYREFCDNLEDDEECNEIDERFIATPVLGFFCFVGWIVIGVITLVKVIRG